MFNTNPLAKASPTTILQGGSTFGGNKKKKSLKKNNLFGSRPGYQEDEEKGLSDYFKEEKLATNHSENWLEDWIEACRNGTRVPGNVIFMSLQERPYREKAIVPMQSWSRLSRSFPKVLTNLKQEVVDEYFNRNEGRFDPGDCDEIVGTCYELEKKFFRLTKKPDASEIRPLSVLKEAFMRLQAMSSDQSKYKYLCDQLRAIRQDLTVQKIRDKFAVEVYELNAKLTLENKDLPEFNQCQSQLRQLYADLPGCENEYEFTAYRLLYHIYTENDQDILSLLNDLDSKAQQSPFISFAISVHDALLKGYHIKLFKLYKNTSFAMCRHLMDLFLDRERIRFIKIVRASYKLNISIAVLSNWFQFSSEEEFTDYMKAHGIPVPSLAAAANASNGQSKTEVIQKQNGISDGSSKVELPKKNGVWNGSIAKLNTQQKKTYAQTVKHQAERNEQQKKVNISSEENQEFVKNLEMIKKKLENSNGHPDESSTKLQEVQDRVKSVALGNKRLKIQLEEEPVLLLPAVVKEIVEPLPSPKSPAIINVKRKKQKSKIDVQRLRAQKEIIKRIKATILKERCKRYIAIWKWATRKKREYRIFANFATTLANSTDDAIAGISKIIKPVFAPHVSADVIIQRIKERQIQSKYFKLWRKAVETRRCERENQKERLSFIYSKEYEMPNLFHQRQEQKKRAMEFSLFSSRKRPSNGSETTSTCSSSKRRRQGFMTSTPIIGNNVLLESPSFTL